MKVQALTAAAALLLVQLSLAPALAEGAWDHAPERQLGAENTRADPWLPAAEGDNLSRQGSASGHPPAREGKVVTSRAMAGLLLGSGRQDAASKPQKHQLQPSRSRGLGLSHHLKGYGKFNTDTYSCHGIQSRPCQKPSDCDGCLGLYTCKLPKGTCDLKAVSRERGGFLQSI